MKNKTVTIKLSKDSHFTEGKLTFAEGEKIRAGKNMVSHVKVKAKRVFYRLLKKPKYEPMFIVTYVVNDEENHITGLTLKRFNF